MCVCVCLRKLILRYVALSHLRQPKKWTNNNFLPLPFFKYPIHILSEKHPSFSYLPHLRIFWWPHPLGTFNGYAGDLIDAYRHGTLLWTSTPMPISFYWCCFLRHPPKSLPRHLGHPLLRGRGDAVRRGKVLDSSVFLFLWGNFQSDIEDKQIQIPEVSNPPSISFH